MVSWAIMALFDPLLELSCLICTLFWLDFLLLLDSVWPEVVV